jgi:apolipoprotein N-acyltransferase
MVSFVLAILSGIVLSGAFAPLNWWFLAPISVVIILYAVTKTRNPYRIAFVFALIFNYLTLRWTGTYVGIIPVLFLILLQSLFYIPLGFISYKRARYSRVWLILPILLLADEVRSIIPFGGFGWNRLAFSQADAPYIAVASSLGDTGLGFIAIALGIALYLLWARAQLFSVASILILTTIFILIPRPISDQGSASVLGVQGNVPRLGLDFNSRAQEVFNYHVRETETALKKIKKKPDVILWPENSVDVDPFVNAQVGQQISDLARSNGTPIIVGAVLQASKGPENASIMWNAQGELESIYTKRSLTPFGEYIPLRSLAELVSPLARNVVDFIPGARISIHKIGKIMAAPIICYEIIDDSTVQSILQKSNLLFVQTNNATFASSAQSMQQLNITRIRAVENNRWAISVSTTGVSAVMDNFGQIKDITAQNIASFVFDDVKLISERSFANRFGNWNALIVILVSSLIYARKRLKHER